MLNPMEWKDRPAMIERLLPVQKLSVESYKEQMAGSGKTLTALGSYWKARKPLILNKACILGCLLPASEDPLEDLRIYELLMAMDDRSLAVRLGHIKPADIAVRVQGLETGTYFVATPEADLPATTCFDIRDYPVEVEKRDGTTTTKVPRLKWNETIPEPERLRLEAMALPPGTYRETVSKANRPEELMDTVHNHVWDEVNAHLGTSAHSFPDLMEEIGVARFGHRPRVADTFCGSGQIPFEAARLGCDVYASDLNPIACMLTWGAFNIVGAPPDQRKELERKQRELADKVQAEIDALGVETDGNGWRAKAFLYCLEVRCPESGWMVPILPNLIVNRTRGILLRLKPHPPTKMYDIEVAVGNSAEMAAASEGTVVDGAMVHSPDGQTMYRTKISTLRGDYKEKGKNKNRLRLWEKEDFIPRPDDVFQERLYCVQWMRPTASGKRYESEFRSVTEDDLAREQKVIDYVGAHLAEWQAKGWVPDMVIERGAKTDEPIRTRGWTHWHHLFNPRQLLQLCLLNRTICTYPHFAAMLPAMINLQAKLCAWHNDGRKGGCQNVFSNQALNTLHNYGVRGLPDIIKYLTLDTSSWDIKIAPDIRSSTASEVQTKNDLYITDPPYGDAVKYEEITEFFIAWLRKNPPKEFADWTWDSRRALAIKGEDEDFRREMIDAYRAMAEHMPDNGIQVLMFTHQSGAIWGDMTNIIWASGLQVTAAWYVVTETDSSLRKGANVKGTVLLVLRKRTAKLASFRDDLGWEIEEAVKQQVESLSGLDEKVRAQGAEALYSDADLQMAGYAAALKVLTTYSTIDGKDMENEARAPRVDGAKSFVDELIEFAVQTAVKFLVPAGFESGDWQQLQAVERYYLKMVDMEAQGEKSLENYQNFAKAFKVQHFDVLLGVSRANAARLKLSHEFSRSQMGDQSELGATPLRKLLYALWEVRREMETEDVLLHLMENMQDCGGGYSANRQLLIKMADYLARMRDCQKPTKTCPCDQEASAARVLAEAIRNQRL